MLPDERTAPVVLRIFREYLEGRGQQGIADCLNTEGIASPGSYGCGPGRPGSFWTKSAVRSILTNPRYASGMTSGPDSEPTACPAIVSLGEFEQVQMMFASRQVRPRASAALRRRQYLLRGLLRCARCNRLMQGTWNNAEPYYRCRWTAEYTVQSRDHHPRNVYLREKRVLGLLKPWLDSVCARRRLMQVPMADASPADRKAVLTATGHSLKALHEGDTQAQADALGTLGLRLIYADAEKLLHAKVVLEPVKLVLRGTLTV